MLCTLEGKITASPLNGNSLYFYPFSSRIMSQTAPHCQLLSDYKYKIMQHQVFQPEPCKLQAEVCGWFHFRQILTVIT